MTSNDSAVDDLYAAPLDEFTSKRNALAKELGAAGDKEAAKEVKALTKPTAAAWTLNQLARSDRSGIDALLGVGEKLRAAQRGEGGDLRSLHAQVREQVTKLLNRAEGIAEAGGRQPTQPLKNRLMQSLMAAAAQEEAGSLLRAGRLTREPEPGGFEAAASDLWVAGPAREAPSPRRKEAESKATALRDEAAAAEAEAEELSKEAERAERAAQRARARAQEAAAAAETKRARAEAAARALEEA